MKLNVFFGNKKAGSLESTENRGVIFYCQKKQVINSIQTTTSPLTITGFWSL